MTRKWKYTENLRIYLDERNRPATPLDIARWISTLSDAELSEFGDMVRMTARGQPTEDAVAFMAVAMTRQGSEREEAALDQKNIKTSPSMKDRERFLARIYENIVSDRKERLKMRGRHIHRPHDKTSSRGCPCCAADD